MFFDFLKSSLTLQSTAKVVTLTTQKQKKLEI